MSQLDIFEVHMKALNKSRTVRIWKPYDYDMRADKHYPVIYMHDGQNLFDLSLAKHGAIWDVHTTIEHLMKTKLFEGAIVVGVDCAPGLERLDEYSPWVTERMEDMKASGHFQREVGGEGEAFAEFLVHQLKPYVDSMYRTKPDRANTLIAGSSMGGLMSLYFGAAYPNVFSKVCAMSTAAWFADRALFDHMKKLDVNMPTKWYLDVGTKETSSDEIENFNQIYIDGTLALERHLLELGVSRDQVKVVVEEGGTHYETAWARRLPSALEWLFGL